MTDKERIYYQEYYAKKLKKQGKMPRVEKIQKRQDAVCDMKKMGKSHAFVARQLHVNIRTVTNDVKALKEAGRL